MRRSNHGSPCRDGRLSDIRPCFHEHPHNYHRDRLYRSDCSNGRRHSSNQFTVVSSTEITATTPATSTVGQVDVLVTTPSGISSSVSADEYTFAETATTVPLPLFIASPTSGTAPLEVTFTDESTGSPASWSWDFGDGNTSTLENPTNTYANDGTYSVTLTEENSLGTNATTMTGYIVVGSTAPVAAFIANRPTSGTAPLTVQFTDQSTGSPTSWEWSFGDGSTSSLQNPSETYQNAGTYTVTLTSSNSEGSSTNTASQTITVDLWSGHNRSHYGVHDGPHLCGRR